MKEDRLGFAVAIVVVLVKESRFLGEEAGGFTGRRGSICNALILHSALRRRLVDGDDGFRAKSDNQNIDFGALVQFGD